MIGQHNADRWRGVEISSVIVIYKEKVGKPQIWWWDRFVNPPQNLLSGWTRLRSKRNFNFLQRRACLLVNLQAMLRLWKMIMPRFFFVFLSSTKLVFFCLPTRHKLLRAKKHKRSLRAATFVRWSSWDWWLAWEFFFYFPKFHYGFTYTVLITTHP